MGGFGKFQLFAYFATSTAINTVAFIHNIQFYLMQEPKYECELVINYENVAN